MRRGRRPGRAASRDRRTAARALRNPDPGAGPRRGHRRRLLRDLPELTALETLGIARRGYFVEGLGGAQFALPGAVERLRAVGRRRGRDPAPLVLSSVDPPSRTAPR